MITEVMKLTVSDGVSYTSADELMNAYGPMGMENELVLSGTLELQADGSFLRTLYFETIEDAQAHVAQRAEGAAEIPAAFSWEAITVPEGIATPAELAGKLV